MIHSLGYPLRHDEFGGGFIPDLNVLAGVPVPAPECLTLTGGDFVPPGGATNRPWSPQMSLDAMESLVRHLDGLREERKGILMVTEGWPLFRAPDQ